VDISLVIRDPNHGTGLAVISVDESAQNAIIVIPGANGALDMSDVERAKALMGEAKVLMLQLEVPVEGSLSAAKIAREKGITVIFDPAPAASIPDEAYSLIDYITPNETETEALVGILPANPDEAAQASGILRQRGVLNAIIKMGSQGAYYQGPEGEGFMPAFKVNAIDTVAAGDAFNAGLAVALKEGKNLEEAVRWGAAAGAIATTRKGALPAMPYRADLEKLLAEQT
jgi:ribokinase